MYEFYLSKMKVVSVVWVDVVAHRKSYTIGEFKK